MNANFHKVQAEEMIKKLNAIERLAPLGMLYRDIAVTLAHALLATTDGDEDGL